MKDKFGRKEITRTYYANGYVIRYHNTRISCIDIGNFIEMTFARVLDAEEIAAYAVPPIMQNTSTRWVHRGKVQYQKLRLSKKAAILMLHAFFGFAKDFTPEHQMD